jgi:hypothetical protein
MESFLHGPTGTPGPYDPSVLARSRHGVLRLHDPTEPKAPRSSDPCTLFSTSPQSFWALRFNRTLSAREPCGSRASTPALRSSLSTARPNPRTLGPCDPYVFSFGCATKFEAWGSAESKAPRSFDPCTLFSTSPQSFWALRFNRTLSARKPCGSHASAPAP